MTKRDQWDAANEGKRPASAGPLFDTVKLQPDGTLIGTGSHPALADIKPGDRISVVVERGAEIPSGFAAGLAGSEAAAGAWTEAHRAAVVRAVETCAKSKREFTSDDVWALLPHVPVTKGIASILNGAARRGTIRNTGQRRVSDRGGEHDHGQSLVVWVGC